MAYRENAEKFKTEICTIASRFHFFPSLVQMNFSVPEKCKIVAGENKLLCLSVYSEVSSPSHAVRDEVTLGGKVLKFSKATRVNYIPTRTVSLVVGLCKEH